MTSNWKKNPKNQNQKGVDFHATPSVVFSKNFQVAAGRKDGAWVVIRIFPLATKRCFSFGNLPVLEPETLRSHGESKWKKSFRKVTILKNTNHFGGLVV